MKKKAIALMLSVVLATGSIGAGIPVLAAETTAEEAVSVEKESEQEQIDETEEAASVEDECEQEQSGEAEETEDAGTGETAVEEEIPAEEEGTEQEDVTDAVEQDAETEDTVVEEEAAPEAKEKEEASENTGDTSSAAIEEIAEIEEVETAEIKEARMAGDVVDSGACGENATWTLTGTGDALTLTISGSGEMDDYEEDKRLMQTTAPWYGQKIKKVIVKEGITSIGDNAFSQFFFPCIKPKLDYHRNKHHHLLRIIRPHQFLHFY